MEDAGRAPGDLRADVHAMGASLLGDVCTSCRLRRRRPRWPPGSPAVRSPRRNPSPTSTRRRRPDGPRPSRTRRAAGPSCSGPSPASRRIRRRCPACGRPSGPCAGASARWRSQRAGLDAFAHQPRHLGDLVGVGLVVGVAAVAQHIGPDRRVRHVRADVDRPRLGLQASRYSGKLSHVQSIPSCRAEPGMSSTPSISSIRKSWASGRTGAKPTPQLPMIAVVTPCQDEGASTASHVAWPS